MDMYPGLAVAKTMSPVSKLSDSVVQLNASPFGRVVAYSPAEQV